MGYVVITEITGFAFSVWNLRWKILVGALFIFFNNINLAEGEKFNIMESSRRSPEDMWTKTRYDKKLN